MRIKVWEIGGIEIPDTPDESDVPDAGDVLQGLGVGGLGSGAPGLSIYLILWTKL